MARLLVAVTVVAILLYTTPSAGVSVPYMPDYYWIGSGYDTTLASLVAPAQAVAQPVVQLGSPVTTPDGLWSIPNNTEATPPSLSCVCGATTDTLQAAYFYRKEVSHSLSALFGLDIFSMGASTDMSSTYTSLGTMSSYIYDCYVVCGYYTLTLNPYAMNVTDNFRSAAATIPTSFDPNSSSSDDKAAFEKFYSTYKSSVINKIVMGGRITQRMITEATSQAQLSASNMDVGLQAQACFEATIGLSVSYHSSSTLATYFNKSTQFDEVEFTGGDLSQGQTCGSWSATVPSNPAPINFEIVPLIDFLTSDNFPSDPDIGARASAYQNYIDWYQATNTPLYSVFPGFTQVMGYGGQKKQEVIARCPEGSVILGGGCKPSPLSNEHPWRLTQSIPVGTDEWDCIMGEDWGSDVYYQDVFAYAVCSPSFVGNSVSNFTVSSTFVSASSDNSKQKQNSVSVQCPSDTTVTGGGCSVSGLNQDHPWQIHASQAQDNGWFCDGGEDWGSDDYDQTVYAYAVCATFTSNVHYLPLVYTVHDTVSVTSSDSSEKSNTCMAYCPENDVLTGGGCSVSGMDDNDHPWRITYSVPQDNGWACEAGEDWGSNVYNQEVTCSAICMQAANPIQ